MYLYYIFTLGLLLTLIRFSNYVVRFFEAPSLWFTLLWFTFTHVVIGLDLQGLSVEIKVLLGTLSGVLYGIIIDQNIIQLKDEPLKVQRIRTNACIPTKGSCGSVGLDVYSTEEVTIAPGEYKLVSTGLIFTLPTGTYGRIAPRSGLSTKGIDVKAGVIDPDYKGEVKVLLLNFGTKPFICTTSQRVAQLILEKVTFPKVEETWECQETQRGEGGFGSTGE